MILYLKHPNDVTQKHLDQISSIGKIVGYKTNIQKSVDLLYINNEEVEKKIRKTMSFTIASKNQNTWE
jgi:uncharacterized protein YlbG (UPF0298 family)